MSKDIVSRDLTGAMARRHVYNECHKRCRSYITHVCDQMCSDYMTNPHCASSDVRYPMLEVGRVSLTISRVPQKKSVCERRRCSATCGALVTHKNHEYNKLFCANCKKNKEVGHVFYDTAKGCVA